MVDGGSVGAQSPFQLFPDLRDDEYGALKRDIEERGMLIPIEVDQDGVVLDGHHRLRIAHELGIEAPRVQRTFQSDDDRTAHVIALNLKRRHLDPVSWGEMFIRYAEVRGVRLEERARNDLSGANVASVAAELGVPERTAKRRMEVARLPEALKEQVRSGDRTTRTALQEHHRQGRIEEAVSLEATLPTGKFQTIVADPPWAYERDDIQGVAMHHYDTMTFEEIAAYPVEPIAADNAHLYLWVTNPHLPFVWDIVTAWGFEYKTMLTWVKTWIGLGHYFRSKTEHVLFCTRGSLPLKDKGIANTFEAPRTEHSTKPEEFYKIVGRASYGPYCELFARREREGWQSFGDEL